MAEISKRKPSRSTKHLMLPTEAIMTIDILESYLEKSNMYHVAFLLGVSKKHLVKFRTFLIHASQGDPVACAEFNSRIPIMRNLYAYNRLLEIDPEFMRELMRDAILNQSGKDNILHKRGGKVDTLSGLSEEELNQTVASYTQYVTN
ncbi:hypothetical protein ACPF3S_003234 [Vibrio cholerae]|uniref:Uncharacterized protein n=1 Tax=Vibrio cholerae TaxID=666 RepID=A0A7Z7VP29_VIBCL|nr:hypothetical protein [Vibrio cholerae]EGQ7707511.1 hypothetical protein [Vibrio cholerae]EGR5063533.1 hypothetical protein [Vibrio cholerae]EII3728434.1 hypothetical protein [Vibrio cholerae]EMA3788909.1 hypothetical protein [Vibrio cholerae]TBM41382.1 hypothetical protein EYB64_12465 [Vibrio cholerae]